MVQLFFYKALGYANSQDAIKKRIDLEDRIVLGKNEESRNATLNYSNRGNRGAAITIPVDPNEPEITFDLPEEAMRVFQNEKFGEVRTCVVNGMPYFAGSDVAKALGYSDAKKAIRMHVDKTDRVLLSENKGGQNVPLNFSRFGNTFINESGLFSLIHEKRRRVDACDAILF